MGGFPCIRFSGPAQPAGGAERIRDLYSVGVQPSVFLNTWEKWAEETIKRGENYFYYEPVNPENPNGELRLCEKNLI